MARTTKKAATTKTAPSNKTENKAPAKKAATTEKAADKVTLENLTEAFLAATRATKSPDTEDTVAALIETVEKVDGKGPRQKRKATINEAFSQAVAETVNADDPKAAIDRASTVRSEALAALAPKASTTKKEVDHEALFADRIAALAIVAAEVVNAAEEEGVDTDEDDEDRVAALRALALLAPSEADDEARAKVWKAAFGGRRPDAAKVPGGGSRQTKDRDLSDVTDGPVSWTTTVGDEKVTFAAKVADGVLVADGDQTTYADGKKAGTIADGETIGTGTVSGACKALTGASVNGWNAWERDGRPVSALVA